MNTPEESRLYHHLSSPQMGIWYTELFYPSCGINNIAATLHYAGRFDFDCLEVAFNEFVRMNEGIRLRLEATSGEPRQYVADYAYEELQILEFPNKDSDEFLKWQRETTEEPLFGANKQLYKFCPISFADGTCAFYIKTHHVISDAWSMVMFGNEVVELYKTIAAGKSCEQKNKASYLDFLEKDAKYAASEKCKKDREYWLKEFESIPDMASIKARKKKYAGINAERKSFHLPDKLVAKLHSYSEEHKKSVFSLFLSALAIYMNRVTEKEELVVGVPVLNRGDYVEKTVSGLFVSTVPIKISMNNDETFMNFLDGISHKWMEVLRHHKYPVYQIMRDIRDINPGIDKLYDIMLSYQNAKVVKEVIDTEFVHNWNFQGMQSESLYIHISDREDSGRIMLDYDYLTDVFSGKDIEALHDHVIRILWHSIDAAPDRLVRDLEMVSENEKQTILHSFNDTCADFPSEKTMIDIFRERASDIPYESAVFYGDRRMTYKEIDEKSETLARFLHNCGVGRDTVVGIMVERSFEMMISILAIWKAGGAYMPIDPEYPEERIGYMFDNSRAKILLTMKRYIEDKKLDLGSMEVIDVADGFDYDANIEISTPLCVSRPEDLAYVIYTSGSTGRPKGVMNEHRALVNRINWMHKKYPIDSDDMILQKTTYTFDVSVWELTWWFFAGAKMIFLVPGGEKNPGAIITAIEQYAVTTMHFVPSMLGAFLTYLDSSDKSVIQKIRSLRRVFASGEALTLKHTEKFNELLYETNSTTLHNLYGPTEAAIDVSYYDCPPHESLNSVPIGRPIDNIRLYIVNKFDKLQPITVAGELCIAGVGLARGYLNNEELTNEKFVDNPFEPGTKMYRTGDLARWYPKGDIEYLGRIDSQIKIRGFRIELGEIQTHILKYEGIKNAVVTSVTDSAGDPSICAYIIAAKDISLDDLSSYLKTKMPEYMIPQSFMLIDEVPLLGNGKINYKALPKPEPAAGFKRDDIVTPRNQIESELFTIWCSVLEKSNFGVTDDFFSPRIGGDSLRAIEIVCALPKKDGALIDINDFYQNPTIESFAKLYLDDADYSERSKNRSDYLVDLTPYCKLPDELNGNDYQNHITYICCPYGGGSAYVYMDLAQCLKSLHTENGEVCNIYSVNLPGHRFGGGEQEFVDTESVANKIMNEIRANPRIRDSKIIIYAHCVGNALGLKLVRRLENESLNVRCMISGGMFPQKMAKRFPGVYDPWKHFSDEGIMKYLLRIGLPPADLNEDTRSELMAAFRFDVREYYAYLKAVDMEGRNPVVTPIISIVGENDPMTRGYRRKVKSLTAYTCGKVSLLVIPDAKHYFMKTHAAILAARIREKLIEDELIKAPGFDGAGEI